VSITLVNHPKANEPDSVSKQYPTLQMLGGHIFKTQSTELMNK